MGAVVRKPGAGSLKEVAPSLLASRLRTNVQEQDSVP